MQDLATLLAGGYRAAGLTKLKLTESLPDGRLPPAILDLGATLEQLDLSGTGLASLPVDLGVRLPRLRIAFFSGCQFREFPAAALAGCGHLEMVAFRNNGMTTLPASAFADAATGQATALAGRLRWLILTDNRLSELPASIGQCGRLEKCMLSGNQLTDLPVTMAGCTHLTLLRLSANRLTRLPAWLLVALPRLAFLSFAGNPCAGGAAAATTTTTKTTAPSPMPHIDWDQIEVHHVLGEGASGVISKGVVKSGGSLSGTATPASGTTTPGAATATTGGTTPTPESAVAIKIFRGALTSDGTPYDEMAANMAAGHHVNLVRVHGQIRFAEEEEGAEEAEDEAAYATTSDAVTKDAAFQGGIVMELIPPHYRVLGQPPSFATCTRDCFDDGAALTPRAALAVLAGVASAAEHLHARGIAHGDLYAHNILVTGHEGEDADSADGAGADADGRDPHALLSDFGASTLYGGALDADAADDALEKIEVLAFAHLIADVLGLLGDGALPATAGVRGRLQALHRRCAVGVVADRPPFAAIVADLRDMQAVASTSASNYE